MAETKLFSVLVSRQGSKTHIGSALGKLFNDLAKAGEADAGIMSTEEGFSPLGASRNFFESDLGIPYDSEIRRLAHWNRFENTKITLIALKSRRPDSVLRGIILAPGSNTKSYEPFARLAYARVHRDFYYNVAYEAIAHACLEWGASKLAISHLSSCGQFSKDMATCQTEALAHFCDQNPEQSPQNLTFCNCCIKEEHFDGIGSLNDEGKVTNHRPIKLKTEQIGLASLLHLDWSS